MFIEYNLHTDGKVSARFAGYSYRMAFIKKVQRILKTLKKSILWSHPTLICWVSLLKRFGPKIFIASKNTGLQSQNCQKIDILLSKIKSS